MPRMVFEGSSYVVTHTCEEEGPHITRKELYHKDDYFTISWLLQGKGKCFVSGNCYSLVPGDAIMVPAKEVRRFAYDQSGPLERISLYLLPSVISPLSSYGLSLLQIFNRETSENGVQLSLDIQGESPVWHIIGQIKALVDGSEEEQVRFRDAEMHLLILHLLVHLSRLRPSARIESAGRSPDISNVCQYIRQNISQKLTYQNIQESCRVSRYQLGNVFPHYTGMTLTEYIIQQRLMRVAELVASGEKIEFAAIKSGFQNYSNFYKMFMKYRGIAPKEYFKIRR